MNDFALRSNLNASPATLATVVVVHVAAALLIVQLFEARRHVEPAPITVSLLPVAQEPDVLPKPLPQAQVEPVREIKREPLPEPVKPEPVREIRHEPKPVERVVVPEPAPERAISPIWTRIGPIRAQPTASRSMLWPAKSSSMSVIRTSRPAARS